MMKKGAKVGVLCFMTAAFFASQCFSAMSGVRNLLIEDPEGIGFLGNVSKANHWWEARGGYGGVLWDDLSSVAKARCRVPSGWLGILHHRGMQGLQGHQEYDV